MYNIVYQSFVYSMKKSLFILIFLSVFNWGYGQAKTYTFCLDNVLILMNDNGDAAFSMYDNSKKLIKEYQGKYKIEFLENLNQEHINMDIKFDQVKLRLQYYLYRNINKEPEYLVNKVNGVKIPLCNSLKNNTIVNKTMTKEEAIKILKEKKELLDLGLITQSDYEIIKKELSIYILKN